LTVDGTIEISKFEKGEPGAILDLWLDPQSLSLPVEPISIFTTIKSSGKSEHILPTELASLQPFITELSEHQFTVSKNAIDKIGVLVVRQIDAKPGVSIVGHEPHQDYATAKSSLKYPVALAFFIAGGLSFRNLRMGLGARGDRVTNIYHTATVFPTKVQASAQPDHLLSAQPNQAAMANNYCWHAASEATIEQRRLYIHLAYVACS
jgi:hypothetical protein